MGHRRARRRQRWRHRYDVAAAKLTVREEEYLLSGEKHFVGGSGMTPFKITTAIPEGESEIESFFMDSNGMDRLA